MEWLSIALNLPCRGLHIGYILHPYLLVADEAAGNNV